jgi:dTDP-L-rhamnose 4-epimerase
MKVLLTGAGGFVGRATWDELCRGGHEVVPVDLYIPQAHSPAAADPDVHRLDVRAAGDWGPRLWRGVDVVCHLAAMVGAGTDPADLPGYAGHNDLGTAALLSAMHAAGVSAFVQASSMVVYGEGRYRCRRDGPQRPADRTREALDAGRFEPDCPACGGPLEWESVPETAPLRPRSAYAASKVAQEHYAAAWAAQAAGRAISLRYHNIYGPGMPRDTPYSGVAAMFRSSLERGARPQVFEDGQQVRDFVHVDDVARATVLAVHAAPRRTRGSHAAYNVASGSPVTILDVAREVSRGHGLGLEPEVTGGYRSGDVRHVVASPLLAAHELGFSASVAPQDGLRRFAHDPLR